MLLKFPFPPNGKVLCKEILPRRKRRRNRMFPFPPNGKVLGKSAAVKPAIRSNCWFPFPPNGKVLGKFLYRRLHVQTLKYGFHSLRTGKCFASVSRRLAVIANTNSFHSLRTGKCFARDPIFDAGEPWLRRPPNQTRTARGIFFAKIYPKNPTNPDKH